MTAPGRLRLVTLGERPDLLPALRRLTGAVWPPTMDYLQQDAVCLRHWPSLAKHFADLQPLLCGRRGRVVAGGYTIPFVWDGRRASLPSGVDGVLERGVRDRQRGRRPTALSALLAMVDPAFQGRGLSRIVIRAMATLAARNGLRALVAPVRPTLKHRYPLAPMEHYVRWRRPDGAPFDPWLRVHQRLGARVLRVAPRSMVVQGRVRDWERWTGIRFPASGRYVVPGALVPVSIDRRHDRGRYIEPNVWMLHPLDQASGLGLADSRRAPGWAGRDERLGGWGHVGAPMCVSLAGGRGASRLGRGATSVWGVGGHVGAPMCVGLAGGRGASRLGRGATSVWGVGGHVGAPMCVSLASISTPPPATNG